MTKIQKASSRYALIFALISAVYFFLTSRYLLTLLWVPESTIVFIESINVPIFIAVAISYGFYMVFRMQGYFRSKRHEYYRRENHALYEKGLLRSLIQIYALEDRITNVDELLTMVCQILSENNQYALVWVGLRDTKEQLKSSYDIYPVEHQSDYVQYLRETVVDQEEKVKHEPGIAALRKQRTIWLGNMRTYVQSETDWTQKILNKGVQSVLCASFKMDQKVGSICLYSYSKMQLAQDFHYLVSAIVTLIASKLYTIQHNKTVLFKALYDPVSRLPNSYYFEEKVDQIIHGQANQPRKLGVAIIKICEDKTVKEISAEQTDDAVLLMIVQKYRQLINPGDILGRLGGNTFGLMLDNVVDESDFCHKVGQYLQSFNVKGENDTTSVMNLIAGLSLFPDNGDNASALLTCAKKALVSAEQQKEGGFAFYTAEMKAHYEQHEQVRNLIRGALVRKELQLFYQAIVNLRDESLIGIEAYVRWLSPELGELLPPKMLPIAKEMGVLSDIENWVIDTGCKQMHQWMIQGRFPEKTFLTLNISVNKLIEPGFAVAMGKIANHLITKKAPWKLIIEFPEAGLTRDFHSIHDAVSKLKGYGIDTFIDDFGVGAAHLKQISEISIKAVKIDEVLVKKLGKDQTAKPLVQGIIAVAKGLGLLTIAEGVETEHQVTLLKEVGCDLAQGYYFAAPAPPDKFDY